MSDDDRFDEAADRWVHDLLAAEPRPSMPPQVLARITAALAAEAAAPRSAAATTSRFGGRVWLGAAAAAVVLVLAGIVVVPRLTQQPAAMTAVPAATSPTTAVTCPDAAANGTSDALAAVVTESGTAYSQASLRSQAEQLLARRRAACATAGTPTPAGEQPSSMGIAALRTCVVTVAHQRRILAVDLGTYGGAPAVAVVLLGPKQAMAVDCQHAGTILATADLP